MFGLFKKSSASTQMSSGALSKKKEAGMTRILYIVASPRGENSQSSAIANAYIERRKEDPSVEIDVLELWKTDLIEFDGDKAAAKMTFFGEGQMDNTTQSAWDQVVKTIERFVAADEYVISAPMWNGGIPYKLKHYIDIITQPGLLFGFDPENGYSGLLENKKAKVFYTAGVFAPGADAKYGQDFHSTYLNWWLELIGVSDIEAVRFQPSLLTPTPADDRAKVIEAAIALS